MSASVSQFLVDTLVYTGLLIVLVLALRAPVARLFGPQVAYTLWALPLLRLFMPPLQLPASMAPTVQNAEPLLLAVHETPALPTYEAAPAAFSLAEAVPAVWVIGAVLFLAWRTRQYFAMRRTYLAGARPMGEVGRIRLVETPAADLPLAFGIRDKVVALPPGFMALHDRNARDLAIAHELAHHRGHDLLANLAAQLLLALHWFNPLAWAGWRAMRKDQEAACDARVVTGRGRTERIAYAEVIAGFAAGDRLALAAPLACRILGEKSIIHRLRTLTLAEVPTARRRMGLLTVMAGVVALPLTASISYAQPEVLHLPEVPLPPTGSVVERQVVIIDEPLGAEVDEASLHKQEVQREDGSTVILRTSSPVSPAEARERVETAIATMPEPPAPPAPPLPPAPPNAAALQQVRQYTLRRDDRIEISATAERQAEAAERQARNAEREAARAEAMAERHAAQAESHAELADASALIALESVLQTLDNIPMPEEARAEARREIEREIAAMRDRREVSSNAVTVTLPGKEWLTATVARVGFQVSFGSAKRAAPALQYTQLRQIVASSAKDCPDETAASQVA